LLLYYLLELLHFHLHNNLIYVFVFCLLALLLSIIQGLGALEKVNAGSVGGFLQHDCLLFVEEFAQVTYDYILNIDRVLIL
jgi:hypothetical protein